MSLVELIKSPGANILEKTVQQLIGFAGEGQLLDGNSASKEFREYLASVPSSYLDTYANQCLSTKFDGNGFALQDIINEIGERLGFDALPGRYRGTVNAIGFDGLWVSPEGQSLVIEVKTTDAYSINLDTVAKYRQTLIQEGKIQEKSSSILIVVGRQDTGNVEAQVRGSHHAWDVRLISVNSLIRLLNVKEKVEDPDIEKLIRTILVPREYTRVDGIIELVFNTISDVAEDESQSETDDEIEEKTKRFTPVNFTQLCVDRIVAQLATPLVRRSRAVFSNADNSIALLCAVSRTHDWNDTPGFWFAFHGHQRNTLAKSANSYVSFGCGSPDKLILIPFQTFVQWTEGMNQTNDDTGRHYCHVKIVQEGTKYFIQRKKGFERIEITQFLMK
ncbi:MAG: hypothetical protein HUU02_12020 [Bacteroidetes bacterium]|nr:hypothetical protein [Bacteroidota bacterium]